MDAITILAKAVENAEEGSEAAEAVVPIDLIWEHITALNLLEALTFIAFGAVCLFYGWRVFKMLVVICFGLLGIIIGVTAGDKIFGDNKLLGGLIGLVAMAAVSVPLMRWAVSILGAIAGGVITAGVWYAAELTEQYIWAGALVGIVAGGMISFIIFKVAIMLFSSLGGSALMVTGCLALLYQAPQTTEKLQELVFNEKWFLPVVLMGPTLLGAAVQNKFLKTSQEWNSCE